MKYTNDSEMSVGDCVWWNGGITIGYIRRILERKDDILDFGLVEPSVLLSVTKAECDAPIVAYPESKIADDGIEQLTIEEVDAVQAVICAVAKVVQIDDLSHIGVTAQYESFNLIYWTVHDYSDGGHQSYRVSPLLDSVQPIDLSQVGMLYHRT